MRRIGKTQVSKTWAHLWACGFKSHPLRTGFTPSLEQKDNTMFKFLTKDSGEKNRFSLEGDVFFVWFAFLVFVSLNFIKIVIFLFLTEGLPFGGPLLASRLCFLFVFSLLVFYCLLRLKNIYFFVIFYIIQFLYLAVNLLYYLTFGIALNIVYSFSLISEGLSVVTHGAIPWRPELLVLLLDLPFFLIILIFYKKTRAEFIKISYFKKIFAMLLLFFLLPLVFMWARDMVIIEYYGFRETGGVGESFVVSRYGTLVNNFITLLKGRDESRIINKIDYGGPIICQRESFLKNPNFILIQVESLDSNIVDYRFQGEYVAPFLAELRAKSYYFPYFLSYHGAGGSSDAEFSAFNSAEPLSHFPVTALRTYNFPNSFIKQLTKAGYETKAFHNNYTHFFNRDIIFQRYGFLNYFGLENTELKSEGVWGASDEALFNLVKNNLKNQKEPFYYHIITVTSHSPFTDVYNYYHNQRYNQIGSATLRGYFNSISYVDKQLENFVEHLRKNFPFTYIFIYGDHTPAHAHGIIGEGYRPSVLKEQGRTLEFVPLFIITPENDVYKEKEKAVSFLDIAPTMLCSAGIDFDMKSRGEDMLGEKKKTIPFQGLEFPRAWFFRQLER